MTRALALAALAAAGCFDASSGFSCGGDGECVHGGVQGRCEASRYCSFPDSLCASGFRFGDEAAAPFAGQCVSELDLGAGDGGVGHLCLQKLAEGSSFGCALDDQGQVLCWGLNTSGQLGTGATSTPGMDRARPDSTAPVVKLSGQPLTGATDIAVGSSHACALTSDGNAWCWGIGTSGQLGTGNTTSLPYAAQVKASAHFTQIALGSLHTCAIDDQSKVWCWGSNASGQVDPPDGGSPVPTPTEIAPGVPPAVRVAAASAHSCAACADGSVWCWGTNSSGQLGNGTTSSVVGAAQASAAPGASGPMDEISAGDSHTCARQGGSVWCWGLNSSGQLGQGDFVNRTKPTPVTLAGQAMQVSAHGGHTCARYGAFGTGRVACWGSNQLGEVGTGDEVDTPDPFPQPLAAIDLIGTGANQSCARSGDGILWCWGAGGHGQLGDGQFTSSALPVASLICP